MGGRHHNLPAVFARVTRAGNKHIASFHTKEGLKLEGRVAPFSIDTGRCKFPRPRSLDSDHCELGTLMHIYAECLCLTSNPRKVFFARCSVDDESEPGFIHEVDDQVINDATVFIKHAGVEGLACILQLGDIVGDEVAQEVTHALAL